jgi:MOSC domain-containing protein YiiM
MTRGKVEAIYIAHQQGEPTILVDQAHAVPGMGIEGDRYFGRHDISSKHARPGREITLIELEAIVSMNREEGIPINPGETRRNIVTRGIALNELVDRVFYVGNVQLRGVRLCQPCQYLADRTDPRVLASMSDRGGLRAEIVTEGIIHINDIITTTA